MRTIAPVAVVIVLLLGSQQLARPPVTDEGIKVHFSPDGGCTDAIVETLGKAKTSIDVQAYSFTSTAIATAIAEAHDRGLKVRVILDKKATGDQYSGGTYLTNHGVPTFTDGEHTIAHNKLMIVDGQTVITGSFNFTKQAENSNAENLLIITGKPKLAAAYAENFSKHLKHSKPYEKRD